MRHYVYSSLCGIMYFNETNEKRLLRNRRVQVLNQVSFDNERVYTCQPDEVIIAFVGPLVHFAETPLRFQQLVTKHEWCNWWPF